MKQLLKNGSGSMKKCLNIGIRISTFLYQSNFRHFIVIRYTIHDPDYNSTVLRASNPAPPPVMTNWPPVSRGGRRPRDRHWGYVYYNSTVDYDSTKCLGDHREGIIIIKDPVTMTIGTWIMMMSLKDIVAVNDNDFNKGEYIQCRECRAVNFQTLLYTTQTYRYVDNIQNNFWTLKISLMISQDY